MIRPKSRLYLQKKAHPTSGRTPLNEFVFVAGDEDLQRLVAKRPQMVGGAKLAQLLAPVLEKDETSLVRVLYLDSCARLVSASTVTLNEEGYTLLDPTSIFRNARAVGASGVLLLYHHLNGAERAAETAHALSARLFRLQDEWNLSLLDSYIVTDAGWRSEKFGFRA